MIKKIAVKNRIKNPFKIIGISLVFFLYISPLLLVFLNSFKTTKEFLLSPLSLPKKLNFQNYIEAFSKMNYIRSFTNSLIVTVFSTLFIILFSSMTAYILVRKKWKINKYIFFIMVASMLIPFQAIMIPLVKLFGSIGMMNNVWALIYMYIGFGVSLAIFIYHGFIKSIPLELEEAAMIDGASTIQVFFHVIFPLLRPTTITIAVLDMLWIWNDFLLPNLVLLRPSQMTLPLSTYKFYQTYTVDYGLLMSGLVMTVMPLIIVYAFLQKYIIKGIIQGSIK
ncbi:MAG: carbohydrate ABC transporter permease [Actinomycetota bacterium]|nr:carbohydrate ABC transporter permease [Actinomycetota bacterium]